MFHDKFVTMFNDLLYSLLKADYSCLTNVPSNLPNETTYADAYYPGQVWTLDDQCRARYGSSAAYCHVSSS